MRADQLLLADFVSTRNGDLFGELVHRHAKMVFGVCRRVLNDSALAEDATQETFMHLLRQPGEVTGSLVGWLHRVAHGKAVDLVRREAAHKRRKEQAIVPEPQPDKPWSEISPLLDEAMAEIPEEQRAVLVAHYLQGANQSELAQQLNMSQSTISRKLQMGLDALRERLAARGVVHSVAALGIVLQNDVAVQVPLTLMNELGKMTMASHLGVGGSAAAVAKTSATGTSLFVAKVAIVSALVGGGSVAALQTFSTQTPADPTTTETNAWRFVGVAGERLTPQNAPAAPADIIGNDGPLVVVSASPFGGIGNDAIFGIAIAPDHTIVVAANLVDSTAEAKERIVLGPASVLSSEPAPDPKDKNSFHPSRRGMIARLSHDGRSILSITAFGYGQAAIKKMTLDESGAIYILGDNKTGVDLGGGTGKGTFVAKLDASAKNIEWILYRDKSSDFAIDGNGDLLVLSDNKMVRFDTKKGQERWTATWKPHGQNRPSAISVDSESGIAAVIGYGMTHTGKEPWKDPFAFGFDRDGKQQWELWNPDPKKQVSAKFGGNGLMADTSGNAINVTTDGKFLMTLFADGGNSVCTRDPADPNKPLDEAVMKDVYQKSPGHGFKGASKTSVVFRVDSKTGTLEKGTWMCAWLSPQRANGLAIEHMASDQSGTTFVVGSSASNFPLHKPWYPHVEGAYQGGGYLAVYDRDFKMLQSGYFNNSNIRHVACRNGWIVIGGDVKNGDNAEHQPRFHHAVQSAIGGDKDGYIMVLRVK